jgi:tetratricopeptide (TPR) repeat protein
MSSGQPLNDAFVGRECEMARLGRAHSDMRSGRGALVLLTGEAGIGKTRTAAEFAATARREGTLVLWGGCYDGEWAPPFGPFAEAITAYARQAEPDILREDLGFGAAPIARVIPAVRERLPDLPEPVSLQPDEERFRLLDAIGQFLSAVARHTPLLLVLDDLHWADKGTIGMLRHVARFAPRHQQLILGTYRDGELDAEHPLTDALGALYRETTCEHLQLKGLAAVEVGQLVSDSGIPADRHDTVADAISTVTDGNPFFVRAVLRHLAEEQSDLANDSRQTVDRMAIPDSVRQVVHRRVRRLDAEAGHLLSVASAFGGSFHLEVAARVAGLDEAAALEAVDAALRAQLVRPAGATSGYDFTHALIRETLYSQLSPSRQVRLHRQLAEAMEQTYGDRVVEHAAAVAQQYHRSTHLPGAERGVPYAIAAADRAEAMYAHDEVVRLLRIAVELTPQSAPRPARLLGRLAFGLTWVLNFDEAARMAREVGELIASTEGTAAAADYLGEATINLADAGSLHSAFKVAREGMRYIGERRDLTWLRLASYDVLRREEEDAEYPGIPLDRPERREMSVLARSLSPADLKGIMLLFPQVHEEPRSPEISFMSNFRGSLAEMEELATDCERQGLTNSAAYYFTGAARCRLALGDIQAAEQAYAHAVALRDRLLVSARTTLGFGAYRFERCAVANEGWADVLSNSGTNAGQPNAEHLYAFAAIRAGAAVILARLGQAEAALQMVAGLRAALDRGPAWAQIYPAVACNAAATLWCAGRVDYAECVERNLLEKVIAPDSRFPMVDGRLALAQVCALQRRYDEAVEWFARARGVLDEQGARPLRAIVDYDEALMYVRRGDPGDVKRAAPLLDGALAQFRDIGMPGWIRCAEHLLRDGKEWSPVAATEAQSPAQRPSDSDRDGRPPAASADAACVFQQEGEYWTLAYGGRTARLRHTKGLLYIARLLEQPGCVVHVRDLAALGSHEDAPNGPEPLIEGDLGTLLDARATAEYRSRLTEARQELDEATAAGDAGRAARARHEIEMITERLAAAYGLGGRARRTGDPAERLRKAVTNQIRRALERIGATHPTLGRHLTNTLQTGFACTYHPEHPVTWRL